MTVRRVKVWRGQNGVVLDHVLKCQVYDCDCSFLSGWGVALWRSNGNVVARNALDFCVRGYSHGVYNRGQDSAGILCFEQSCDNIIAYNSATHCGDGFGLPARKCWARIRRRQPWRRRWARPRRARPSTRGAAATAICCSATTSPTLWRTASR